MIIVHSHISTWISELVPVLRNPPNTQPGGMLDIDNLDQYPPLLPPAGRPVSPSAQNAYYSYAMASKRNRQMAADWSVRGRTRTFSATKMWRFAIALAGELKPKK